MRKQPNKSTKIANAPVRRQIKPDGAYKKKSPPQAKPYDFAERIFKHIAKRQQNTAYLKTWEVYMSAAKTLTMQTTAKNGQGEAIFGAANLLNGSLNPAELISRAADAYVVFSAEWAKAYDPKQYKIPAGQKPKELVYALFELMSYIIPLFEYLSPDYKLFDVRMAENGSLRLIGGSVDISTNSENPNEAAAILTALHYCSPRLFSIFAGEVLAYTWAINKQFSNQ
jgi:hypothetical protein